MGLKFDGSASYLAQANNTVVKSFPLSMFIWSRPLSAGADAMVMGGGGSEEVLIYDNGSSNGKMNAWVVANANANKLPSASSIVANQWQPTLVVFRSTQDIDIYYASGAKVNGALTGVPNPTWANLTEFCIGARPSSHGFVFYGDLAEAALWGSALTQSDFDALAAGALPETVQSASLIESWPLLNQAATQTGTKGAVLTNGSSTTQSVAISGTSSPAHPISRSAATAVTLSGSTSGQVGSATTYTVGFNGVAPAGNVTVTPNDGGKGGSFSPTSVAIGGSVSSATFTYTPAVTGAISIGVTNNGGLTNPSSITMTASAAGDTTKPTMNGSLTLTNVSKTGATLSWVAGSDNVGVTGYKVDYGDGNYVDVGNVLTVPVTGKQPMTSYVIHVVDYDAAGNVASTPLAITLTTLGSTFACDSFVNNTQTGVWSNQAVSWVWQQGGRVGSAPTTSTYGTGTIDSNGNLTLNNLPAGAGYGLVAVRNTSAADDYVYYIAGTAS